jgi:hypothetical protein
MIGEIGNLLKPNAIWLIASTISIYWVFFVGSTSTGVIPYRILIAVVIFASSLIMFNASYSGRKALQILRIGGGIPVSIISKTMMPDGKDVIAHTIDGCMILNAGSHIIIQVVNRPTLATCQELPPPPVKNGEILKGIEIISGSDVIKLEGL